jgi:hypothetical protein
MIAALDKEGRTGRHILHAVIGVWYRDDRTFYIQRSDKMENYPGAWSLFSIQYDPDELPDSLDLTRVQRLMDRMSAKRLHGTPIVVRRFLTASTCTDNPINKIVNLRLYRIELASEPVLNPDYYIDAAWMTRAEYLDRRGNAPCGSCLKMWSDYSYRHGSRETRFALVPPGPD